MRAATVRILILLLTVCAVALGWEASRNSGLQPVAGRVVAPAYLGYAVRYRVNDAAHHSELRIGLLDRMGPLGRLRAGDPIPLLASADAPHVARLDTLTGRHPVSLSCFSLLVLVAVALALGRRPTGERVR